MPIQFNYEEVDSLSLDIDIYSRWIAAVSKLYNYKVGAISYIFCDDEYLLNMNITYLQHDYYTDVITFDYSTQTVLAGDVFISVDTVASNANEYNVCFEEELNRVIIHGVLHLCGLKDHTDEEDLRMRQAEDEALLLFKTMQ